MMGNGSAMIKTAQTRSDESFSKLPAVLERGADAERRTMILDQAEAVFLEDGFQGASMAAIAARAGCSKGTLYNYFISKEELFVACVARQCAVLQNEMSSLITGGGAFADTLRQIGERYVAFVSSDVTVRRFRTIVAEAERVPEIARAFYATGPARGAATLAEFLETAMREGVLRTADPLRAAHHFFSLCYNHLSKARLCNYEPAPDAATIEADVAEAVELFTLAYGVR